MPLPLHTIATVGARDLDHRMRLIAYCIRLGIEDPWTHEWVASVTRACPASNEAGGDECEVRAIFAAFMSRMRYNYHPQGTDHFRTLRRTWELGAYDCDQACIALCTALAVSGFNVGAEIMSNDGRSWGHIAPLVQLPRSPSVPESRKAYYTLETTTGPDGTIASAEPFWQIPRSSLTHWQQYPFDFAPSAR